MTLDFHVGQCTLLGNYRENNEDAVAVLRHGEFTLALVADGMGGQAAGEIASQRAVEVVIRELKGRLAEGPASEEDSENLRLAFVRANAEILAMGELDADLHNMGSTLVAALCRADGQAHLAHLGDSRAYLVRGEHLEQLTTDHTMAAALEEAGVLNSEEARVHRGRHFLWKYLGCSDIGRGPDLRTVPVQPGDSLLLCTDGLSSVVPDEVLRERLQAAEGLQACAEGLGQLALDRGSRDNISCVVLRAVARIRKATLPGRAFAFC